MKIKKNGKVIKLTESDLKKIVKKVLREQEEDTELYVYDEDKVMVGTMDYKNRQSGYEKFIPNGEGTKRGYKKGDDIPEGTRTLKSNVKP